MTRTVLAVTLAVALVACAHATSTPGPDRAVLVEFFDSTGGESSWVLSNGWGGNSSYCTWFGVQCDSKGRVYSLSLDANGVTGTFPSCLGSLSAPNTMCVSQFFFAMVGCAFTDF